MIQAMLRLFVGVLLPQPVRDHALAFAQPLRHHPGLRWLPSSSLHITLKFIGSIEDKNISKIQSVLSEVAAETVPFSLALKGGGVFPSTRSARIFWTGLDGGVGALAELAKRVEEGLAPVGIAAEARAFKAHVTLAKAADGEVPPAILSGQFCTLFSPYASPSFSVNEVHLIQSHLNASGSSYQTLNSVSLRRP